jgi:hypothetical protein
MPIRVDVFYHQNKVKNEGKGHIKCLHWSWFANSCDGDTALSELVAKVINNINCSYVKFS